MQKFTKIEVSWMAVEFEKMAKEHEQQSKETSDRSSPRCISSGLSNTLIFRGDFG